jgi:hypothetical protein
MKRVLFFATLLLTSAAHAQPYKLVWDDVRKPWRPDALMDNMVQADAAACDQEVGAQKALPSARYKACMRRHDWKLNHVERLPPAPVAADSDSPPPDDWQSRFDDDRRHDAEQQQMFQDQLQQDSINQQLQLNQQQEMLNLQQQMNNN